MIMKGRVRNTSLTQRSILGEEVERVDNSEFLPGMFEGCDEITGTLKTSVPPAHSHDTRFKFKKQQSLTETSLTPAYCRQNSYSDEVATGPLVVSAQDSEPDLSKTSSGRQTRRPRHLKESLETSPPSAKKHRTEKTISLETDLKKNDASKADKGDGKPSRCRYDIWTLPEKALFYEGLCEHGKDFDKIQAHISCKLMQSKRTTTSADEETKTKNVNQVRFFYYREWKKISQIIDMPDVTKCTKELYGLINFRELWKRSIGLDEKSTVKLNELIKQGFTSMKVMNRIVRLKTPNCKALRKRKDYQVAVQPDRPNIIEIVLRAHDNDSWAYVQAQAYNPRVRVKVSSQRRILSLLDQLQKRWRPTQNKLRDDLQNKLESMEGSICNTGSGGEGSSSCDNVDIRLLPPATAQLTPYSISEYHKPTALSSLPSSSVGEVSPTTLDKVNNNNVKKSGTVTENRPDLPSAISDVEEIRRGWVRSNAGMVTVGDVHLVLGEPEKLELEYEVCGLRRCEAREPFNSLVKMAITKCVGAAGARGENESKESSGGSQAGKKRRTPATPHPGRAPITPHPVSQSTPTSIPRGVADRAGTSPHTPAGATTPSSSIPPSPSGGTDLLAQATKCIHPSPDKPVPANANPYLINTCASTGASIVMPPGHLPSDESIVMPSGTLPIGLAGHMPLGAHSIHSSSVNSTSRRMSGKRLCRQPTKARRVLLPPAPATIHYSQPGQTLATSSTSSLQPSSTHTTSPTPHDLVSSLTKNLSSDTPVLSSTEALSDMLDFSVSVLDPNSTSSKDTQAAEDLLRVALYHTEPIDKAEGDQAAHASSIEGNTDGYSVTGAGGVSIYSDDAITSLSPFKSLVSQHTSISTCTMSASLMLEDRGEHGSPLTTVRSGDVTFAAPPLLHDNNSLSEALVRITTEQHQEVDHMLTQTTSDLRSKFADLEQLELQLENTN